MDHPQNIDQTPISHLFELPNIHQNMCKSVEEMIRSRTMQLIAIQTLRKINPQKASLYKKMLERNLSIDEALSLIKIIGRFLRDDSTVLYQFPSNEENIVDFGLEFLKHLGDTHTIIPCLEIIQKIILQTDQSEIFENTLAKYGMYPIYLKDKLYIVYTDLEGVQYIYMGNGVLKNGVDYGEENNILDIGDALLRRDTGELIGYSKTPNYEFHVLTHHHAGVFLVYWDIELQRGIVYQYSKEKKEFEAKKGPYGEVCFIYSWAQAGFTLQNGDNSYTAISYQ